MRLVSNLHVEWVDDEAVVLDVDSQKLHYLSPSAALAFALIAEYGFERGIQELRLRHGEAPDFEADINALINTWTEQGLLTN